MTYSLMRLICHISCFDQPNVPCQHLDQIKTWAIKGGQEFVFKYHNQIHNTTLEADCVVLSTFLLYVILIYIRCFSTSGMLSKKRKIVDNNLCIKLRHSNPRVCGLSKSLCPFLYVCFIYLLNVCVALLYN